MKQTNKGFRIGAHIILSVVSLIVIVPFLLLVSSSFTQEQTLIAGGYSILPRELSFEAYRYLFAGAGNIFKAYGITFLVTALGTAAGLLMTVLLAYALSIEKLPFRKALSFFVFFTMLFNGGLIPTYMMYTNVFHIKNTIAALIVPSLMVNAFFVIIARSYFMSSIPAAVLEAARIDGMSEYRIYAKIMLPLSKPALSTLTIFTFVNTWNDYLGPLIYLRTETKKTIQLGLKMFIGQYSAEYGLIMAGSVVSLIPVIAVFLCLQKYFVEGVASTGLKG